MKFLFTKEDGEDFFNLLFLRRWRIKLALLFLIALGIYSYDAYKYSRQNLSAGDSSGIEQAAREQLSSAESAFANGQSDLWVTGSGRVVRILADDLAGSRHQRFILKLASGQTLLVAHNIDLAARINSLAVGDRVHFRGEYEWNAKGGVIHWTHHDPRGRHEGGWLLHAGRTYK